ncbi:OsmC family peroxiredoxin [Aliikangiella marina]|uniref:OsmC family peroxiredoxin n=1 Tax=Aliikangiella marina TaxID=1712262 RepID=A0A545TH16_9GAMM|nr:OsmC family protein [Aliikangiella marina]TQV76488.1 OsmC family peroxiredoxin [Aliikangiella marina]
MSSYFAEIYWQRNSQDFLANEYSRGHEWRFDGGVTVPASASPHIVPLPWSVEENVDPEEAFAAALSSCHMLFFLSIASKRKIQVESYTDKAEAIMENNSQGKMVISKVILKPQIAFSGEKIPTQAEVDRLHHLAHESCFLANSVKCEVIVVS